VKKALIWVGIGVTAFAVLVVVIFVVLSYLEPEPAALPIALVPNGVDPKLLAEKQDEINNLNKTIFSLKDSLNLREMRIDSLQEQIQFRDGIIREYTRTVESLNSQTAALIIEC